VRLCLCYLRSGISAVSFALAFGDKRAEEPCLCTRGRRRCAGLGRRGEKKGARSREEKRKWAELREMQPREEGERIA
jgi:hypothetical protein